MDRVDAPKTKEEWVKHFKHMSGFGAVITEGPAITAVCDHMADQDNNIMALESSNKSLTIQLTQCREMLQNAKGK